MGINELLESRRKLLDDKAKLSIEVKKIEEELSQVETAIAHWINDNKVEEVSFQGQYAKKEVVVVPKVIDWAKVYKFVSDNNAFDLLKKEIKKTTFNEYIDKGIIPDGTEVNSFEKVSFRFFKGKKE